MARSRTAVRTRQLDCFDFAEFCSAKSNTNGLTNRAATGSYAIASYKGRVRNSGKFFDNAISSKIFEAWS